MIVVVDSGATSTNVGDRIISESVDRFFVGPLRASGHDVRLIPMHGQLDDSQRQLLDEAESVVACGTNLLADHMRFRSPWQWATSDIARTTGKLTVLGTGWWQYQRAGVDPFTARWLRSLAGPMAWALRDEYSAAKLSRAGIAAVHTSCPTVWTLDHQALPSDQSRVVVTVTDYNQDPLADRRLHGWLTSRFQEVVYWPQGPGDARYIRDLFGDVQMLDPTLDQLDENLDVAETAYIGLRLHAGIRAIQHRVPTLILSVDNRAREISASIGLGVTSRYRMSRVDELASSGKTIELAVPAEAIAAWLEQWGLDLPPRTEDSTR